MNFNLFKPESKLAFPRCEQRSPSGRQCSQPVCSTDPRFCGTHKPTPEQLATTELTEAAGTLSSPDEVHRFLKAVLLNRVRGRITPKEASVYSYLCQNLLRSLREIDHFHELQSERAERTRLSREIGWHLPRPDRDDPPKPATTNSVAESQTNAVESSLPPIPPPASPVAASSNTPNTSKPPAAATPSESSSSLTSSTSFTSKIPPPPFDPRHLYPLDPTLPHGAQDHSHNIPPPDEAECRRLAVRRGLDFKHRRPADTGAHR
ncbi:MAG TPA: hypothetical protein VFI38_15800 [Candidatus Acidoferrum sp.]|nr:hypothetical protein [Candidatus Acidoferrum sp.]